MLKGFLNFCGFKQKCPTTIAEDEHELMTTFDEKSYNITSYPQSHTLYEKYNELIDAHKGDLSHRVCRGNLSYAYINSIQKDRIPVITLARMHVEDNKLLIVGFSQWTVQVIEDEPGSHEIFIHTICTEEGTPGLGRYMVGKIIEFVKGHIPTTKRILLNSLGSAKGFYKQIGFTMPNGSNINVTNNSSLTRLHKTIGGYSRKARKLRKHRKRVKLLTRKSFMSDFLFYGR